MKRILPFVVLVLIATSAFAQPKSRIVTDSLYSNVLQCMKEYDIYLPRHYDENKEYRGEKAPHRTYGEGGDFL